MDNETLIEMVRHYKMLYDVNDKGYCDNQKKDYVWTQIGKKLKRSGKDCKKTWALLRDSFRRAVKKRKNPEGGPEKKWKYQDEMSFLLPYMKERPSKSIIDNDNEEFAEEVHSPDTETITDILPTQRIDPLLPTVQKRAKLAKRREETELIKLLLDKKNTPPDDIEQFMTGITTTLRSFPARDKAIAKARIFEIVSHMEIDILSRPSTSDAALAPTLAPYHVKVESVYDTDAI